MKSSQSNVAKQIQDLGYRALYTHSYGHALNLVVGDTFHLMKHALEMMREISKPIKHSPHRNGIFQCLKQTLPAWSMLGIRALCQMRWTVCTATIYSIIAKYETLERTWDEAITVAKDTEAKARIRGAAAQMRTFTFLFGSVLMVNSPSHTQAAGSPSILSMPTTEGQEVTAKMITMLNSIHNDK